MAWPGANGEDVGLTLLSVRPTIPYDFLVTLTYQRPVLTGGIAYSSQTVDHQTTQTLDHQITRVADCYGLLFRFGLERPESFQYHRWGPNLGRGHEGGGGTCCGHCHEGQPGQGLMASFAAMHVQGTLQLRELRLGGHGSSAHSACRFQVNRDGAAGEC
jgi:hypothetical protein